jgi:hypothetical protein
MTQEDIGVGLDASRPDSQYEEMNNGPHERPFVQVIAPGMAYHAAFWFGGSRKSDDVRQYGSGRRKLRDQIAEGNKRLRKNIASVREYFDLLKMHFLRKNPGFKESPQRHPRVEHNRIRTWVAIFHNDDSTDQITLVAECHNEYWRLSVIVGFMKEHSILFPEAKQLLNSVSEAGADDPINMDDAGLRKHLVTDFESYVDTHVLPKFSSEENDRIKKECVCTFIGTIFWKPTLPGRNPDFDIDHNQVWALHEYKDDCRSLIRSLWPVIENLQGVNSSRPGFRDYEMTASTFLNKRAIYASSLGHPMTPVSEITERVPVVYSLFVCFDDAWQIGRLIDTIHSMGVLRIASLRDIEKISDASGKLGIIRSAIREDGSLAIEELQEEMDLLLRDDVSWRIERSQRYWRQFLGRVARLRIGRIEGFQPYDEFVSRRIGDTITFIESTGRQLAFIRKEIDLRQQIKQTASLQKHIRIITALQKGGETLLLLPLTYYAHMLWDKALHLPEECAAYGEAISCSPLSFGLSLLTASSTIWLAGKSREKEV